MIGENGGGYEATLVRNILRDNLTETRAMMVADGTKMTSGMVLISFSWGTLSPALLAAMAAGGVIIPVMSVESSNLLRFTFFFMNSMNTFFFSDSFASFHSLNHACNYRFQLEKREGEERERERERETSTSFEDGTS